LFSIAPEKGSVTAGASLPVVFTYKLPTTAASSATATKRTSTTAAARASVDNSSSAASCGWTSYTATVKLKGGAKGEGEPDVSAITVVLRVPCAKS
jgi:hypothetical protein